MARNSELPEVENMLYIFGTNLVVQIDWSLICCVSTTAFFWLSFVAWCLCLLLLSSQPHIPACSAPLSASYAILGAIWHTWCTLDLPYVKTVLARLLSILDTTNRG